MMNARALNKFVKMNPPQKTSGWRGSRDLWLDAAKDILVKNGYSAVKIQPLARHLGIARTSFYWFFKDRDELLDALLALWEAKNNGAFLSTCTMGAQTISEAILNLIVMFYDESRFETQLDFAIRGWAHHADEVAKRIMAADEVRLSAIREMFLRFGFVADDADVRARTVYLTQIGYISMQIQEDIETRLARAPGYVKTFCGKAPTQQELERFYEHVKAINV